MTAPTAEAAESPAPAPTAPSTPTAPDPAGLLAAAVAAVPSGVTRTGQRQMAEAVGQAVATGEHLLVQAGTGTGKSLAYLVPALLVNGPVVVSTATLALQSQLVDQDLPRLAEAAEPLLRRRPSYAVLKGRHHYLCLAKLEEIGAEEPQDALFDDPGGSGGGSGGGGGGGSRGGGGGTGWLGEAGRLGKQLARLREWGLETPTGDRDELDPGVDDTAWRQVSMPARECVGATKCPYGAECFAEAARERARAADVVVTNHSLLAIDMLGGRYLLPPHRLLVVDEAHELADRVSSAAQAELTAEAVDRAARRTRRLVKDTAAREASRSKPSGQAALTGEEVSAALTEAGDALTIGLAETPAGRLVGPLPEQLRTACTLLDAATRAALSGIGEVKPDDPDGVVKQPARAVLEELSDTAQRLLLADQADVAWVEKPDHRGAAGIASGASQAEPRGRQGGTATRTALVVAPLSVAETLADHLYRERTVVATSATLALGGTFDTIARTLGLPPAPDPDPAWRGLDVGSPFDYPRQGILYVAAHLPRPRESGLPDASADELVRLVSALGGGTLGLFSSRRAAERAAEVLRERTELEVLLQGEESLPLLVRRFREQRAACLLGVMSLWQGVDVPGDACQLVVIDRLPFPRPDEPLAAARSAAVDAAGGSGFASVSVPAAAVRLAQGAGRLIRSATDRGVVAVLDSRLHTARGYGQFLRRSLPAFWYTTRSEVVTAALARLAAGGTETGEAPDPAPATGDPG